MESFISGYYLLWRILSPESLCELCLIVGTLLAPLVPYAVQLSLTAWKHGLNEALHIIKALLFKLGHSLSFHPCPALCIGG